MLHILISANGYYIISGRILIDDIPLEYICSFVSILLRYEAKYLKNENKVGRYKIEIMEKEILGLIGERARRRPIKAYQKLFSTLAEEPIYLARF